MKTVKITCDFCGANLLDDDFSHQDRMRLTLIHEGRRPGSKPERTAHFCGIECLAGQIKKKGKEG